MSNPNGIYRGHEIYYYKGHWRWSDINKPIDDKRPCGKCGGTTEIHKKKCVYCEVKK